MTRKKREISVANLQSKRHVAWYESIYAACEDTVTIDPKTGHQTLERISQEGNCDKAGGFSHLVPTKTDALAHSCWSNTAASTVSCSCCIHPSWRENEKCQDARRVAHRYAACSRAIRVKRDSAQWSKHEPSTVKCRHQIVNPHSYPRDRKFRNVHVRL
jgi:hypothetical protein